jgi:hypothetical protein
VQRLKVIIITSLVVLVALVGGDAESILWGT